MQGFIKSIVRQAGSNTGKTVKPRNRQKSNPIHRQWSGLAAKSQKQRNSPRKTKTKARQGNKNNTGKHRNVTG